jgi:hypothetical protein
MRKWGIIFLMGLYLFGATEAYQFLKVPLLIEHYRTHQQMDKSTTFSKFIEIHYFKTQTYDFDYQQDMQLPFKSSNKTVSLLNFISLLLPKPTYEVSIPFTNDKRYCIHYVNGWDQTLSNTIFQPPRA